MYFFAPINPIFAAIRVLRAHNKSSGSGQKLVSTADICEHLQLDHCVLSEVLTAAVWEKVARTKCNY